MTTGPQTTTASPLDRALAALARANAKLAEVERARAAPIAVVGLSLRFPGGARDAASYWRVLDEGVDAITRVPPERWPEEATRGVPGARYAGLLDSLDGFDAAFFGISPREALFLDPQQRLLLELTWEALEDAGMPPPRLVGSNTGVFLGISCAEYIDRLRGRAPDAIEPHAITGNATSVASGRLSYVLGLQGPCASIDTACSSSLVAVHLACQSLRNGESDLALAAGVNAVLSLASTATMAKTNALSPDGRCKTFDAAANGYVRGEGGAVLVLKRLADARRDGDRVHAILRGSAVNQDGRSTGLTAPNVRAQIALLRRALANAALGPQQIDYVETHGTGTPLGDPIEVEALREVYGAPRPDGASCVLGAVKTNLGHLEAAAGMAGLVKAILALRHERIPRNLHLTTPNPMLRLDGSSLALAREARPWPRTGAPRVAGVSSFGISGTNAHVLVEEAPADTPAAVETPTPAQIPAQTPAAPGRGELLALGARSPAALRSLAGAYAALLDAPDAPAARAVCLAAATHRAPLELRLAAADADAAALARRLAAFAAGEPAVATGAAPGRPPRVAFLFAGQGGEWEGMGRELLADEPAFRASVEETDAALAPLCDGHSALAALLGREGASPAAHAMTQPATFAVQLALFALWRYWGVEPEIVLGHSFGEIAAACASGALSLADACRVVAARRRAVRSLGGSGAMAAVDLGAHALPPYLRAYEGRVWLSADNAPSSTTLGGEPAAIEALVAQLNAAGVQAKRVRHVDFASHTPLVAPALDAFERELHGLAPRAATLPFFSTVRGRLTEGAELTAAYFRDNLRRPVRLREAVETLLEEGIDAFVEISPHPLLLAPLDATLRERGASGVVLTSLRRQEPERLALLRSLGELFVRGAEPRWPAVLPGPSAAAASAIELPHYPWQHASFWPAAEGPVSEGRAGVRRTSAADQPGKLYFTATLDRRTTPFLFEHVVAGTAILPAAAYADLALHAARELLPGAPAALADLTFHVPLTMDPAASTELQAVVTPDPHGVAIALLARPAQAAGAADEGPWTLHASARVGVAAEATSPADLAALAARCPRQAPGDALYRVAGEAGFAFGPGLRGLRSLRLGDREALVTIEAPEALGDSPDDRPSHPALLDACFQALLGLALEGEGADLRIADATGSAVFSAIARVIQRRALPRRFHAHIRAEDPADDATCAVVALADDGAELLRVEGIRSARAHGLLPSALAAARLAWRTEWLPRPRPASPPAASPATAASAPAATTSAPGDAAPSLVAADPRDDAPLLVAADPRDVAALVEAATALGPHALVATPGEPARGPRTIAADLGSPAGARALLARAPAARTVVYAPGGLALADACLGLIALARALAEGERDVRLGLLTSGATGVGAAPPLPHAAALWGLAEVLRTEHPRLGVFCLDADGPHQAAALVAELRAPDGEPRVAFAGAERFAARLARGPGLPAPTRRALRPDATYLVTGGLTGLGLATAEWLAERGARALVLVARRAPSPEATMRLEALRASGVVVDVDAVDVTHLAAVEALVARLQAGPRPLRGVVHSAAAFGGSPAIETDADALGFVLPPKVDGADHLHLATRDVPLDFFVLYSSIAALLGLAGSAAYAAANAHLEGLARRRRREGLPATAIAWGTWAETGVAAEVGPRPWELVNERRGLRRLTSAQAFAALEAVVFGHDAPVVALTPFEPRSWRAAVTALRPEPFFDLAAGAHEATDPSVQDELATATTPAERARVLTDHVRRQLARVLQVSPRDLAVDTPFAALGLDSILGLDLRNRLEAALGTRLPAGLIFRAPSIGALAQALADPTTAPRSPGNGTPAPSDGGSPPP